MMLEARTNHVNSVDCVNLLVSLPFGIFVERTVRLLGLDSLVEHPAVDAARHCLIILVGGKYVMFAPEDPKAKRLCGTLFVRHRDDGEDVVKVGELYYLNVNRFMLDLSRTAFDPNIVKQRLNGRARGRKADAHTC